MRSVAQRFCDSCFAQPEKTSGSEISRSDADQAFLAEVKSVLEASVMVTRQNCRRLSSPKHKGGGFRFSEVLQRFDGFDMV